MGNLHINFEGSFDWRKMGGSVHSFRASTHGHAAAVRRAIGWLRQVAHPAAIKQDMALKAKGHDPDDGWNPKELSWFAAFEKSPGQQIPTIEGIMRSEVGGFMEGALPPGWVFAVLAFSVGEKGAMSYISNGRRADILAAVKEWVAKMEASDFGTVGEVIPDE